MAMSSIRMPRRVHENAEMRRWLLKSCGGSAAARREVREACAKDPLFYVNAFCFTYDPRCASSVMPFVTYGYQDDAISEIIDAIHVGVDVGIKKSRDMGASWINLTAFEWCWHFEAMKSFLMVSRNENLVDAKGDPGSLFWKIDFLHKHQPRWLMPEGYATTDKRYRTSMHMENPALGSVIDGQSTTGDVGRGDRRTAALIDEFAAFETKAGYDALSSTRDMTKCRIFNSTPKGSANAFYDVIHKSSARIVSMHWSMHPEKNKGLYTSARDEKTGRMELKRLDDWSGIVEVREKGSSTVRRVRFPEEYAFVLDGKTRSPWYDRECSRAVSTTEIAQELDIDFVGSDYAFFDGVALDRYIEANCRDPEMTVDVEYDRDTLEPLRIVPNPKGQMRIWLKLGRGGEIDRDRRFVIGADVSAGTGASNSALAIYECGTNEKVAEYVNPKILPADFARYTVAVARFFNGAMVVPDRSGPTGEVYVRKMCDCGYYSIYRRQNEKKVTHERMDEYGIWLNPSARSSVLESYRDDIGNGRIVNRSDRAVDECRQFIRRMDGTVEHQASAYAKDPSGARTAHGDIVIADALADVGLTDFSRGVTLQTEPETPPNSIKARMDEMRRRRQQTNGELGEGW